MTKAERLEALYKEAERNENEIKPLHIETTNGSLQLVCTRGHLVIYVHCTNYCTNGLSIPSERIIDIIVWLNNNFFLPIA